jgi:hypothetical protein
VPLESVTIAELERDLVARVEALDGSAYTQGTGAGARVGEWRESRIPLSALGEAQSIGHLAFNVFCENARNGTLERDRAPDGAIKVVSDVAVLFGFHIRPTRDRQIPDQRAASDAAIDLARALLALPQNRYQLQPVSLWRPALDPSGEWMLVRLDFLAIHDLALTG